jgi:RNA polymerase sigma factor (sigma-70 family)
MAAPKEQVGPSQLIYRLNGQDGTADDDSVDSDDLSEAFDAHASDVFAFCLRRCGDRTEAEDLLSVVFLEAWRCRDRAVRVDGSWRPWLLGIATNVMRNAARSRRRHHAALARYSSDQVVADPAEEAARLADLPALRDELDWAMRTLSRRERDVADLCLIDGLNTASAAIALGIPEGTVKSRLARSRDRLRALLHSGDITDPTRPIGHQPSESQIGTPGTTKALVQP